MEPGEPQKLSSIELRTTIENINNRMALFEKYFSDILREKEVSINERFAAAEKAVNAALSAAREAINAAMAASEKAILKAESAADKRAEASNEIRAAMMDQQKNFADKVQSDFRFDAANQKITDLDKVFSKRIELTEQQLASLIGKAQGVNLTFGVVLQIITAAGTISAIVSALFYIFTKH